MADNPDNQSPASPRPALRLAGTGPVDAQAAERGPIAVSLLRVQDGSSPVASDSKEAQVIPFDAGARAGGSQPAIRTSLVGARIPGAVIFRLR